MPVLGPEAQNPGFTNSAMKMAITLATFPIFRRPNHIFFVISPDMPIIDGPL